MTEETLAQWNKSFDAKKDRYLRMVPKYIKEVPSEYIEKIIKNVLSNENIEACLTSTIGKMSIITVIENIIRLGLNYETGKMSQCYILPRKEKHVINGKDEYVFIAQLSIRSQGSIFIAKSEGIIKSCTVKTVYANNKPITINSDGSFSLEIDEERYRKAGGGMGEYYGTIVSLVDRNDIVNTKFFPKEWTQKRKAFGDKVMRRDADKAGAWDWFEEMAEAKAVNKMLDPFINESAQLSAIYGTTKKEEIKDMKYDEIADRALNAGIEENTSGIEGSKF